eukprot:s415_g3.t1
MLYLDFPGARLPETEIISTSRCSSPFVCSCFGLQNARLSPSQAVVALARMEQAQSHPEEDDFSQFLSQENAAPPAQPEVTAEALLRVVAESSQRQEQLLGKVCSLLVSLDEKLGRIASAQERLEDSLHRAADAPAGAARAPVSGQVQRGALVAPPGKPGYSAAGAQQGPSPEEQRLQQERLAAERLRMEEENRRRAEEMNRRREEEERRKREEEERRRQEEERRAATEGGARQEDQWAHVGAAFQRLRRGRWRLVWRRSAQEKQQRWTLRRLGACSLQASLQASLLEKMPPLKPEGPNPTIMRSFAKVSNSRECFAPEMAGSSERHSRSHPGRDRCRQAWPGVFALALMALAVFAQSRLSKAVNQSEAENAEVTPEGAWSSLESRRLQQADSHPKESCLHYGLTKESKLNAPRTKLS